MSNTTGRRYCCYVDPIFFVAVVAADVVAGIALKITFGHAE